MECAIKGPVELKKPYARILAIVAEWIPIAALTSAILESVDFGFVKG